MRTRLSLTVNGETHDVLVAVHKTLLEVLREDLGLTGTKHGCELGECGTCTVLVDGEPVLSCLALPADPARRTGGEVRGAVAGNLCRCPGYTKSSEAVELASLRPGVARCPPPRASTSSPSSASRSRRSTRGPRSSARPGTPTTSSCRAWPTAGSCARRTPTRSSGPSTSPARAPCRACTPSSPAPTSRA